MCPGVSRTVSFVSPNSMTSPSGEVTLVIEAAPIPTAFYGISLNRAEYVYREKNPIDAVVVGHVQLHDD